MPGEARISRFAARTQAIAFAKLLDGGYIEVRDGGRPASVDAPAGGTSLARFWFQTPATKSIDDGRVTFDEMPEAMVGESGQASWFRAYTATGMPIWDGSVGTDDDFDLVLTNTTLRKGGRIMLRHASYTVPT